MSTLTNNKQVYYLTHKKSVLLTVLLAIFLTPFALLYTRGILVWLASLIILVLTAITSMLLLMLLGAYGEGTSVLVSTIAFIGYFIFAITDAGRVNNNLLCELYSTVPGERQ